MRDGRHAIEQMRRVARAGVDGGSSLIEIRARMSERHAMTGANEGRNEVEHPLDLRRHGNDADIRGSRFDDAQDLAPAEVAVAPLVAGLAQTRHGLRPLVLRAGDVALEV